MSTIAIVLVAAGAVLLLLIIGGAIAAARRARALDEELQKRVANANAALAQARSEDRGWEMANLELAARAAFTARGTGTEAKELHLVQVVDRPGTDSDLAVFHVIAAGATHAVTLGRRDGAWVALD